MLTIQKVSCNVALGHFIEVQVTDGALYRTKIHCYFLDQTRVVRPLPDEKNYHIFYQMLAGLTQEERAKLHLEGHSVRTLRYLSEGDVRQDEAEDARRWVNTLSYTLKYMPYCIHMKAKT
ncbi:Unconventional myosin-VIIa [Portunus trituberculatus]|uniref:Unconventional myosin-VIIa n=1 Tax=Portunus trituberculatus TaxID=210409 RepID=A0A5B7E3U9_PORTR|nr:Unconventional myosin-VIIa [Portunus trituberculatus]